MPHPQRRLFLPVLCLLCACSGGGGSKHHSGGPLTNIDLAVTSFSVAPSAADPEDTLTLTGTIKNQGTETANPLLGDSFDVRFNLSKDGTFEVNETGFLNMPITAPIPGGGTYDFSFPSSYGSGDTLAIFGNFCNSMDCVPPETGVVGVRVDSGNDISETNEGNNFQFTPIDVVGTRVVATFQGCDFGLTSGADGCDLNISDQIDPTIIIHRPCSNCQASDLIFPNELRRTISVTVVIRNCTKNQVPSGTCGGSWLITATTAKPGFPTSTQQQPVSCTAFFGDGPNKACPFKLSGVPSAMEIRDPNY